MNARILRCLAVTWLVVPAHAAHGQTVTVPNTFTDGTTAVAGHVNANFTAVKTAVDAHDARLTAVESGKQESTSRTCPAGAALTGITSAGGTTCTIVRPVWARSAGCSNGCPATTGGSTSSITVNSVSITAPGAGLIQVSFNGGVECCQFSTAPPNYYDVSGQITDEQNATASGMFGDGGATFRGHIESASSVCQDGNMSAQRTFTVAVAGTYTYYYRANNNSSIGLSVAPCHFYGGAMTAVLLP